MNQNPFNRMCIPCGCYQFHSIGIECALDPDYCTRVDTPNNTKVIIVKDNSVATQRYKIYSSNLSEHTSIRIVSEAPILTFKRSVDIVQASERPKTTFSHAQEGHLTFPFGGSWKSDEGGKRKKDDVK